MWRFQQATGKLLDPDGNVKAIGYSGRQPDGKNKPEMQSVHNIGPIPCGVYRIGSPIDTMTHGPFVLPLSPDVANQMFGRDSFLIHGDSIVNPGTASEGCLILSRDVRESIASSSDNHLEVTSGIYRAPDTDGEIAT